MAYFNEDNVTEQMCIEVARQAGYEYCSADELREAKNDVIVEPLLQEALVKINHITNDEAKIVIQKVKDTIYKWMYKLKLVMKHTRVNQRMFFRCLYPME